MRKFILAGVIVAVGSGSALSADLPVKSAIVQAPIAKLFDWRGFYGGINAGYGRDPNYVFEGPGFSVPLNIEPKGAFGGFQLGYNWLYSPHLLAGVETDFQIAAIKGSTFYSDPAGGIDSLNASVRIRQFATLRGRLGYVDGRSLYYVTGGAAFGKFDTLVNVQFDITSGLIDGSRWRPGYVAGAGYEFIYDAGWSLKVEYLFMDFSFDVAGIRSNGDPLFLRADPQTHMVRIGLNRKFGTP